MSNLFDRRMVEVICGQLERNEASRIYSDSISVSPFFYGASMLNMFTDFFQEKPKVDKDGQYLLNI